MSEATREIFFRIEHKEVMYAIMIVAVVVFLYGCYRKWRYVHDGDSSGNLERVSFARGVKNLATNVIGAKRIANGRNKKAGIAHMAIFWTMTLLFIGTLVTAISYYVYPPLFKGLFYLVFQSLILDLVGLFGICGIVYMLVMRLVIKPDRFKTAKKCDVVTSGLLLAVLMLGFMVEGARIAATHDPWAAWSPVGFVFSLPCSLFDADGLLFFYHVCWWVHMAVAFAWLAYLPFGRTAHVITGTLNIYLHDARTNDVVDTIDFDTEEKLGITDAGDLSAKDRLDLVACVECGRCQDVCPAYLTGTQLSPRELIRALRDGDELTNDALWACTTCRACMDICPMMIAHVPKLVGLRRYKSMEQADMPDQLVAMTRNIETRLHPYIGAMMSREEWCENLDVPVAAEDAAVDVLFWVGCAAAFDERNQKIARAMVEVFKMTGTSFAILGEEENCCGEVARRIGSEYNFESMALGTIELLQRYDFKQIVTICPHCLYVLGTEYRQFGGEFDVIHHTRFIREAGLSINPGLVGTVTYHDPCYLGRWHGSYDDAREVLVSVAEMDDNREASLCCGAGGGHAFVESTGEQRASSLRIAQAKKTGAQTVCTACPYCMQMLEDALADEQDAGVLSSVRDIAELVVTTSGE